jgi:hypothetical protein
MQCLRKTIVMASVALANRMVIQYNFSHNKYDESILRSSLSIRSYLQGYSKAQVVDLYLQ